jgi:uncharacterized protein
MTTDAILCDTSVIVPLFLPEAESAPVAAIIGNAPGAIVISDFASGEFASAVSIRLRRDDLTRAQAERVLSDFDIWVARHAVRTVTEPGDIAMAVGLVRRFNLGLRLPDAIHLALAVRLGAALFTRDDRQALTASTLGLDCVSASP